MDGTSPRCDFYLQQKKNGHFHVKLLMRQELESWEKKHNNSLEFTALRVFFTQKHLAGNLNDNFKTLVLEKETQGQSLRLK